MYTKWPKMYALPGQEANTVNYAVMDFVCHFGCPRGELSDQGCNLSLGHFISWATWSSPSNKGQHYTTLSVMGVWNDVSAQLLVLLPRLWRSKRSVISIFLRSFWLCKHTPTRWPAFLPVCSCSCSCRELRLPIDTIREGPLSKQLSDYPSFAAKNS